MVTSLFVGMKDRVLETNTQKAKSTNQHKEGRLDIDSAPFLSAYLKKKDPIKNLHIMLQEPCVIFNLKLVQ